MAYRLQNGDRVCIVGGGPAGSLAAIHLLRMAKEIRLHLEVLIFEPRDFSRSGPAGCNHCAGILSSRLHHRLESIGMLPPQEVIQAEIKAYSLHFGNDILRVEQPDPIRRILSVFRGAGPRHLRGDSASSFDGYLLSQACALGASHVPQRVRKITQQARPVVHTSQRAYRADLLVLASGVNSRSPLSPEFGYKPPKTEIMAQDEILFPPSWSTEEVAIYFKEPRGLIFGALTPKGRYLNVSLLGKGMTMDAINDFFEVQGLLPRFPNPPESLCGCNPRIAITPAKRYFGDRWVAVGDAAVTRLYKDGIGSAFTTSMAAMQTALYKGVTKQDFRQGYAPICRRIHNDNRYGRLLFRLWGYILRSPPLLGAWIGVARQETGSAVEESIIPRILWGMFTGDEPYHDLFLLSINPRAWNRLFRWLRISRRGSNGER